MGGDVAMTGGCMCGAIRYATRGDAFIVGHCHCESCRKHCGAGVGTLVGFKADQVTFSGAARDIYESSPDVGRAFCSKCGTPLTWEGDGGDIGPIVEIHIGTFDNPHAFGPTSHAFYNERLPWVDKPEQLPRFEGFPGDSRILQHGPTADSSSKA